MTQLISRRDALAAGFAALALPNFLRAADTEAKKNPFHGFTVGIQSYTFRNFNLERALKKMQDLGVAYGEFYSAHIPTNATPEQIKAILKMCGDYGITPNAHGVNGFSKDHDANKKLFDFGAALGIKTFSADPTPDAFDSLDKLVDEYKISIGIHPHGPQGKNLHRWYSAEVILKAVKDHHPLIGTTLDTGHLIRTVQVAPKLDPVQQIKAMGARNFGLHMKDHNNKKQEDVIFGQDGGVLDVAGVLKALKEVAFKGYISIEYEAKPQDPTEDVKACLDIIKTEAAKV